MTMTEDEKNVLSSLERRIDTVSFLVVRLAERTFTEDELENSDVLKEALAECRHELRVVQMLNQV